MPLKTKQILTLAQLLCCCAVCGFCTGGFAQEADCFTECESAFVVAQNECANENAAGEAPPDEAIEACLIDAERTFENCLGDCGVPGPPGCEFVCLAEFNKQGRGV